MTLHVHPDHLQAIQEHGATSYPYECCGLLLGNPVGSEDKALVETWAVQNVWEANEDNPLADGAGAERRYLIPPEEILKGEQYARAQKLEIIGYYHSHPDHPAQPSEFDREFAWPWYSYVIVAVRVGVAEAVTSWVLDDERHFNPEPVVILTK
jgi:proteasome lid subunit RPN8/RPN11